MTAPVDVRVAYRDAGGWFTEVVASVPDDAWALPGLGVWDVRELVAHGMRAFTTVEGYLGTADHVEVDTVADYYLTALRDPAVHDAVAERGRQAGAALGDDVPAEVAAAVQRVLGVVDAAPADAVTGSAVGGMRLDDYLQTRVLEATVHTLDVLAALGRSDEQPPPTAATVTAHVLADLAVARGRAAGVLRALTGRAGGAGDLGVLG